MRTIDRVMAKYMGQHPHAQEQFVQPDRWTVAMCAVIDEIVAENRRAAESLRRLQGEDAA